MNQFTPIGLHGIVRQESDRRLHTGEEGTAADGHCSGPEVSSHLPGW